MRLFVIRHAHAEPSGDGGDAARRLDDRGRREAEEAGRALHARNRKLDLILTSPLIRARETAEAIAAAFDPPLPVELREGLACGASPARVLETARGASVDSLAIVGHMPDLGAFVGAVTGESLSFRTSSICELDLSPEARILWVRHPDS